MKTRLGALVGLALALVAAPAAAQEATASRSVSFGLAGGIANPVGERLEDFDMGYNLMGTLGWQPAALPVGLRLAVNYNDLGHSVADFNLKLLGADANMVYAIPASGGIRPYLTGGLGVYNVDADGESETKFSLNGGAGLEFPLSGFSTFVEARWSTIFTEDAMSYVPVVFGIRF